MRCLLATALVLAAACSTSPPPDPGPDAGLPACPPDSTGLCNAAGVCTVDGMKCERGSHGFPHPDASAAVDGAADQGLPPLILFLHGYSTSAPTTEAHWDMAVIADQAIVLAPPGSHDSTGTSSWSASRSCCNDLFPDDEDALVTLVEQRIAQGDVDASRVFVWGASNGGFMALRLACDHPELFHAAAAWAGAGPSAHDARCTPTQPTAILEMHGTADTRVHYATAGQLFTMPDEYVPDIGSDGTQEQLAAAFGCTAGSTSLAVYDLVDELAGNETDVVPYDCTAGRLEHWRVNGADHGPQFNANFAPAVLAWSLQNAR